MPRPDLNRVPEFYHGYIKQVAEDDLLTALNSSRERFLSLLKIIPAEKYDYRYADGKWTVKEVVQHIIDSERVFTYRALRFARKDNTPLPGFNENLFTENAKAGKRNWNDLIEEFTAIRKSTELMFASFDNEQLDSAGISNNNSVYVLALGFMCAGHTYHHIQLLQDRYLK
jgi:uncharacterized damage-inducible protein DinB